MMTTRKSILQISFFISLILSIVAIQNGQAQSFPNAVSYLDFIGNEFHLIAQSQWDYSKSVAHGKSAKKVEKRRAELLQSIRDARKRIMGLPAYEGDKSLRDSVAAFMKINYDVTNEDYSKIVNMEEVAEQSYDLMEAYLLAKELASEKLAEAQEKSSLQFKKFAADNNINVVEGEEDKLGYKMRIAGEVFKYNNQVYLVFFKSYKQEMYLLEAMEANNFNGIEQNKNSLTTFATEGLAQLKQINAYKGDWSVSNACKQMLEFFVKECNEKMPLIIDYKLKKENFDKIKTAFDAKAQAKRTKEDVDQYNKAVNEMNQSVQVYNATIQELNINRGKLVDNWNKVSQSFLNKQVP